MSRRKAQGLCALAMLALAALACGSGGTNVQATVDAVDTAVQATLGAMTQPAGSTPAPGSTVPPQATLTPQPTLGIATPSSTIYSPPAQATSTKRPPGPTATTAAGGDQPVRPNGPLLHAAHLSTPPTIDAQGNDWPAVLPNSIDKLVFQAAGFSGPFDQSGRFAMGWDASNFYLYVVIADDTFVQTQHGELLFQGDSLELQFDADLAGDFASTTLSSDDFQLGLSPGENRASPEAFLWNPASRKGVPAGIAMASRAGDAGGYVFEAAIPWSFFNVAPAPGEHFGMALNSSDDDAPGTAIQQSMTSSVATRKLLDPTSWGTIQIDP
jgi:hypothetical protein